ncbi:MAG: aspartate/glutamate racemase family protein [Clostridiales Family XIII bacterium]|jgi:allantoin racemase|nr:aspartate/glutamate racemase family protein [Clostridiales Family XIII bacterium]
MKISVISPILAPPLKPGEPDQRTQFRLRDCARVPADFEFSYIEKGPRFIQNAYDEAYAAPHLIRRIVQAEQEGADAIVINCSADTAIRACREAVSVPVVAPAESAMLFAPQLADTFAVLSFAERVNGRFVRIAHALGLSRRLTCVRSVEIDFDDIGGGGAPVADAGFVAINEIHADRHCDGFLLGCTDFEDAAPVLLEKLQREDLGVVLLKPFEISIHQAYAAASMRLRSGRNSYPPPCDIFAG